MQDGEKIVKTMRKQRKYCILSRPREDFNFTNAYATFKYLILSMYKNLTLSHMCFNLCVNVCNDEMLQSDDLWRCIFMSMKGFFLFSSLFCECKQTTV